MCSSVLFIFYWYFEHWVHFLLTETLKTVHKKAEKNLFILHLKQCVHCQKQNGEEQVDFGEADPYSDFLIITNFNSFESIFVRSYTLTLTEFSLVSNCILEKFYEKVVFWKLEIPFISIYYFHLYKINI